MIKFAKPKLHPDAYRNINEVMESGIFVHGKFSKLFEDKFKETFKYKNASTVSNATTGLQLSHFLLGSDIDPNKNEVICSAMSHVATAHAIEMLGLKPIFVDANIDDGNIDVSKLEGINLKKVRGMTYVHFNGAPADVRALTSFCNDNGLYSVEDCAISLGASVESIPVGLWGDMGAFSFHPVKKLTTGEGGMVVSKYSKNIDKINSMKAFGVDKGFHERKIPGVYNVDSIGTNNRMAELPAAIGCGQLNSIESDLKARKRNFNILNNRIPKKESYAVVMPDYVTLTYDFIIWTSYIEQMNKIVERVVYSDGAYWGDPDKMRFRTSVDTFTDATEIGDTERLVRTNFTVSLRGYLLPEGNFDHRSTTQKFLSPKKVVFGTEVDTIVNKTVGKSGQFLDGLTSDSTSISSGTPSDSLGVILTFPLTFTQGTGVTLTNDGAEYTGGSRLDQTISIGQDVATTSNVTFNQVSASSIAIDDFSINSTSVTGDLNVTGSVTTTGNLTVNGQATITGILTAQEFHTEFVSSSIIFTSGSTKFGDDTTTDTHEFTGSLDITGSLSMNSYNVTEISNDTTLADSNALALVTENAVKTYIDNQTDDQQTYLRKQFVKISTTLVNSSTASFTAVTASAPAGMTGTTEHDFLFFINGQYMEHDAITIKQSGSLFQVEVDTDSIGYVLEASDEILAWGKFDS